MGQFTLNKLMESVNCSKPGYTSFTTKFNDSSMLFMIISCDYLNLSFANEYVGDVTIPTQVIKYNQNFLQVDQPIRLQYSNQIKLLKISLGKKTVILMKYLYTLKFDWCKFCVKSIML
jgi:hypothetical protein